MLHLWNKYRKGSSERDELNETPRLLKALFAHVCFVNDLKDIASPFYYPFFPGSDEIKSYQINQDADENYVLSCKPKSYGAFESPVVTLTLSKEDVNQFFERERNAEQSCWVKLFCCF